LSGRVDNVFQSQYPSGALAANNVGNLSQSGHPHEGLGKADAAELLNLIDSVDISPAAQAAADTQQDTAEIVGTSQGAQHIPPSRGDLNGSAYIKNGIVELGKTS
jgi:hypothetical protein